MSLSCPYTYIPLSVEIELVLPRGERMASEKLGSRGQAWFCTTGLPTDVVIEVDDMSFHLHKFPLMSKSKKLHFLITERENQRREQEGKEVEIEEEELHHIAIPDFPGGAETFEAAAKFCYGVKVELTAWTASPLRCAAEYLEMTEEFAEENLISRTERFLSQSVFRNIRESIKTLKSCESLMPLAEELEIPQRCVDAIAARACSSDLGSLFGWPIGDGTDPKAVLWNGIDTGVRRKSGARSAAAAAAGSWVDDLTVLSLPVYKRVIAAMRSRNLNPEAIEGSLISYAKSSIPGLSRSTRKHSSAPIVSEPEQRELLETVITNLSLEKSSGLVTTRFLFGLLKTVNILRASEASRSAIERKIASQLEKASLDDLLMPSYSYLVDTLYDVDCVERIVGFFMERQEERSTIVPADDEGAGAGAASAGDDAALKAVGKLVDGYLSEIASDANLKVDKFCDLALALPDHARVYDDGLYRAVDLYLKAHPGLTEAEREKVCGVIDCQKLTLEACTHAAQNERLPLRAVVQVLFFEQLQLRRAVAGTMLAADAVGSQTPEPVTARSEESVVRGGGTWRTAVRDNQVLKLDMDSMRDRVHELERECARMKRALESIDRGDTGVARAKGLGSITRKFGCRFGTQVREPHDRTEVANRKH